MKRIFVLIFSFVIAQLTWAQKNLSKIDKINSGEEVEKLIQSLTKIIKGLWFNWQVWIRPALSITI